MRPREVGASKVPTAFEGGTGFWLFSCAPATSWVGPEEGLLFLASLSVSLAAVTWHSVWKTPASGKGVGPGTPRPAALVLQPSTPRFGRLGVHTQPSLFLWARFPLHLMVKVPRQRLLALWSL